MKQVNIGIVGLGTIGRGVFDEIAGNGKLISVAKDALIEENLSEW